MTYSEMKSFAKYLKVKYAVSSGSIRIAEPPDHETEYLVIDWDIRREDVEEFSRLGPECQLTEKVCEHSWSGSIAGPVPLEKWRTCCHCGVVEKSFAVDPADIDRVEPVRSPTQ